MSASSRENSQVPSFTAEPKKADAFAQALRNAGIDYTQVPSGKGQSMQEVQGKPKPEQRTQYGMILANHID